uniref:Uncharacterized LOC107557583 n=1 Tax=Sinocyclocheilus grahami TaxID=75366 RepID=A0A672KAK4_SINGR
MSSSDNFSSHRRRNPHRTCRPISQVLLELHKPVSGDKASILHSKETTVSQDLNPAESRVRRTTKKEKPRAANQNALPDLSACLQKSTHQLTGTNGLVSSKSHELEPMVPEKMTAPKCPSETSKRSQKGRKKNPIQPNEKEVAAKNVCSDGLDNSEHNSCPEQHLSSQKTKGTCYRHSKKTPNNQTPSDVSTALHTCTTLSPLHHKKSSTCHTNSDCSSIPHTPKRGRPLFSSTPTSDLQPFSPKRAKNSCTPHQNIKKSSLVKTPPTDRTPSRRVRHQKPVAAGRPRGRKKKNVEEQPIASPPVKRGRKSAASRLESPQEEPSIEMPPPNKADFETQVSEPQESGCPVRRKYSERKSLLTFPIQEILGMECENSDNNTEDIVVEEQDQLLSKKVLPDRSKAARNRANKQLVDFIIRRKTPPTDRTPSRRVRHQKPVAAGRPRGRKKKNVEEQPIASPPVKRGRKSVASRLESPQEEPSIEMPPPNKADFETQVSEPQESDQNMSSDLSIELSLQEEPHPLNNSLFMEEEEEEEDLDEEEEELPSFLQQDNKRPLSISEGFIVWCKLRKYPYWPAVVKSVNRKNKKASIVFIDCYLIDQKRIRKGFSVSLRTLKPFDCEEYEKLVDIAEEKYGNAITWSLELISDYRIRIGCGSFSGSFIEYCAADISCPVRRKYSERKSLLTFPIQEILGMECENSDNNTEDIVVEEQDQLLSKKVLPDRSKTARNRANKQLVDFIIRRKVESRLLAVISGRESSKWMQALQKPSRPVVDVYLEDEEQVDKVYRYLNKVCDSAPQINTCLENIQADRIRLILDVLLPEAIIYAIAGVHKLSLENAEEKYRRGPCFSNRERQEFDMMIEQQMKLKEITWHHRQ